MVDDRVREALAQLGARLRRQIDDELRGAIGELTRACQEDRAVLERDVRPVANQRLSDAVAEAHVGEREAGLAGCDRLLGNIRRLDETRSLSDVLDTLVDAAAAEAARVVLLIVRPASTDLRASPATELNVGARLRGWQARGFDQTVKARLLDLPIEQGAVIGDAAIHGRTCFAYGDGPDTSAMPSGLPFAALPANRVGFAVPIHIGNRVVAVLYADDVDHADRPVPAAWPEVIEILARYAAQRLESLVLARAAEIVIAPAADADTMKVGS